MQPLGFSSPLKRSYVSLSVESQPAREDEANSVDRKSQPTMICFEQYQLLKQELKEKEEELERALKRLNSQTELSISRTFLTPNFQEHNALIEYIPSLQQLDDPYNNCSVECPLDNGKMKRFKIPEESLKQAFGVYKKIIHPSSLLKENVTKTFVWENKETNQPYDPRAVAHVLFFAFAFSRNFRADLQYKPLYKLPKDEAEELLDDVLELAHRYEADQKLEEECSIYIQHCIENDPSQMIYYLNYLLSHFTLIRQKWLEAAYKHQDSSAVCNGLLTITESEELHNLNSPGLICLEILSCLDKHLTEEFLGMQDKDFVDRLSRALPKLLIYTSFHALNAKLVQRIEKVIKQLQLNTLDARIICVIALRDSLDNSLGVLTAIHDALQFKDSFISSLLGKIYVDKGMDQEALQFLDLALDLNHKNARALISRGVISLRLNKIEFAIKDLNLALEINPNHEIALKWRGIIHEKQKNIEAALKDFNLALEIDPRSTSTLQRRGNLYLTHGDFEKALNDFDVALKNFPKNIFLLLKRGEVYRLLGKYKEALEDFNLVLNETPQEDHATALCKRCEIYHLQGDYNKAKKDLVSCYKLKPSNPFLLKSLHTLHLALKEKESSLKENAN